MKTNQKGFSVIEGLLILVIVGLIGGIGWYVWQSNKSTGKNQSASNSSNSSGAQQKKEAPAQQEQADPYAGWKTYCDSMTNGCFRYPSDWDDVRPLNDPAVKAAGQNKTTTVNLEYKEPANESGLGSFVTKGVNTLAVNNSTLKVVGGYYTASNIPGYNVVDASLVQRFNLAEGKTSDVGTVGLYFTKSSVKAELLVHLNNKTGNPTISTSQANDWFNSSDGKIALLIVQSFYFK